MYLESIINFDGKSFEDFISAEIYALSNGEIRLQKLPVSLNPNSLKNIFVYKEYEINILQLDEDKYKLTIYKPELDLLPSDNLFKFGCELETCLSLECIKPLTKEIKSLFKELKKTGKASKWAELILIYIQEVVLKNADSDFITIFPTICIATEPKSGLVDYVINTSTGLAVENKELNFNEYITFTRDSSLVCGDSKDKDKYFPGKYTIHCEIITPTMTNIGDLEILYKAIVSPDCLEYNPSTSFHVNVSFIKPIYFSFGLCDELIKNYKDFEERNYRLKNKKKTTIYAPKLFKNMLENIIYDIGSVMYYGKNKTYRYKSELFIDEGYYRSYIDFDEKYSSLYCKSNRLIEFRLFSSDNEVENLMGYLKDSIFLLKDSYENYRSNFNNGFEEFQDINLETGIDFAPLDSYKGSLFYKEPGFPKYTDIESLNDINLPKVLKRLFNKRGQKFDKEEITEEGYMFGAVKNNIMYKYKLEKISDKIFKIKCMGNFKIKKILYDVDYKQNF